MLITKKYFEKIKDLESEGGSESLRREVVEWVENWLFIHEQQGGLEVDNYKLILASNAYEQPVNACLPQILVDEGFLAYLEQCEYEPTGVDEITITPFTREVFNA